MLLLKCSHFHKIIGKYHYSYTSEQRSLSVGFLQGSPVESKQYLGSEIGENLADFWLQETFIIIAISCCCL